MTVPFLQAAQLVIFAEAATALLVSSQQLLAAGELEADLPIQIEAALTIAQQQIHSQPGLVGSDLTLLLRDLFRLTPPEGVMAIVQDLVDPDLEQFLATAGFDQSQVRLPKLVICPQALRLLQPQLQLSPEEQAAFEANLNQLDQQLQAIATSQQVDPSDLQEVARQQLSLLSAEQLMELMQDFLAEDLDPDVEPTPGSITVVGPLLFIEIAQYLLDHPDSPLTLDQRLDLQTNLVKAEARYRAMDKLGRIENLADQKQRIRAWMLLRSLPELVNVMNQLFESEQS